MSLRNQQWTLALALAGLLAWAAPGAARAPGPGYVPGTRPAGLELSRALSAASTSLQTVVSERGRIRVSIDGIGTIAETGVVEAEKPAAATVRRAFLVAASTGFSAHAIGDGEITLDGAGIHWDREAATPLLSYNYFTEVTSLVSAKLDGAAAGRVPFTIGEQSPADVDGVALIVVFDDPSQPADETATLFFGAQDPAGDRFSVAFADPIALDDPNLTAELSLGISFGLQRAGITDQFDLVDVNGARLTSSAGGQDDGTDATGALFTIGGLDDPPTNPDPVAAPADDRTDDERYDLVPFLKDGDTRLVIETANPSEDDNLFFACLTTTAAILEGAESLTLTPVASTGPIGGSHALTATFDDAAGAPVSGVDVAFEVIAGPHVGTVGTGATDSNGRASFAYPGTAVGVDSILATASGSSGEVVSNVATRTWTAGGGGGEDTLALALAPISSSGSVGTTHTVTATFTVNGSPRGGERVDFDVFFGPQAGTTGTDTTDATGRAEFSYTGTLAGVDSIVATATGPSGDATSNVATRTWTGGGGGSDAYALSLAPASSSGPAGTPYTLTATLKHDGIAEPARPVLLDVIAGPNAGHRDSTVTDAGGIATFTYTSASAGVDSLVARALIDGTPPVVVVSNRAAREWTSGGGGGGDTVAVTLAPASAVRPVGARHSVTATASLDGAALANARVEFAVVGGPQAGSGGADTTDGAGHATFSYVGATAGVDTLEATVSFAGQDIASNPAVVIWFDDEHPIGGTILGLDVKPTSCVNPINTGSNGVTPVALLGTADVDVRDVDVSTVRLEGVPPLRHHLDDVSRPGPKEECGCSSEGPDGVQDLALKFDTQAFVAALGPIVDREIRKVTLTGRFKDGSPLVATDCILILDDGAPGGGGNGGQGGQGDSARADGGTPRFALDPVVPNPFNPAASISYGVPKDGHVRLIVFDVRGRAVATLVDERQTAGEHVVAWRPGALASGVYFTRLECGGRALVRRAVLAK